MNAILVHGITDKKDFFNDRYPSLSNSHWFPWLQKHLAMHDVETQTPEMPRPWGPPAPSYKKWKEVFEQFPVNGDTVLVGHSAGAGFLLKWLSENKVKVKKLILVAPFTDPIKRRGTFLKFKLDPSIQKRAGSIDIFYSTDEPVKGVKETVDATMAICPKAKLHTFKTMGHFTYEEMKTNQFPALLDLIVH